MGRSLPVGHRFDVIPIQPEPEATTYYESGPLRIGVEYRLLTDEVVNAVFDESTRAESGIDDSRPKEGLDEQGWSIHVCDAATGDEWVRFDGFAGDPHYHYIVPREYNIVIPFDDVAHGDFREWTFSRLRNRLPQMLAEAGARELAGKVDAGELEGLFSQVEKAVDDAVRRHAAAGV